MPEQNSIGREGEGFKVAMFALDQGRYTVAAGATGLIRACRDASVKYAGERKTWGLEIGQHQLVKEMITQMESDYQASRLLWMRSGWLKNSGRLNTREIHKLIQADYLLGYRVNRPMRCEVPAVAVSGEMAGPAANVTPHERDK